VMWLLLEIDMLPSPTHSRHPTSPHPIPRFQLLACVLETMICALSPCQQPALMSTERDRRFHLRWYVSDDFRTHAIPFEPSETRSNTTRLYAAFVYLLLGILQLSLVSFATSLPRNHINFYWFLMPLCTQKARKQKRMVTVRNMLTGP